MAATAVALIAAVTLGTFGARAQTDSDPTTFSLPRGEVRDFGTAPTVPTGPLDPVVKEALDTAFGDNVTDGRWRSEHFVALQTLARSKDVRVAWIVSDMMRVVNEITLYRRLVSAASELLQVPLQASSAWGDTTDHLIAWDVPAPPGYLDYKRHIFTSIEPGWGPLFVEGDIDWRHVSWGGVRIDDRAYDETHRPCNCIPAADNPTVTAASETTWLEDRDVVFGVVVNGEARAYPRRIMEVREMVNDTLGGRSLGIPYCTLCGSAQAYFTDGIANGIERPVLRTSGLLIRSNKVMYDVNTLSVFDTFRGQAVTGPLAEKGLKLEQAGVVTALWGDWKRAHPDTTVLVEGLALGRDFDFRNGRDANGPIFPIGDVDPRLAVQEDVLGIVTNTGQPVAFHVASALAALRAGQAVRVDNVHLVLDGGGVRAVDGQGADLGGHQAFWFAWSQFYPDTRLWPS